MRLFALLWMALLVGAAPVDYTRIVIPTADGGFRQGSPTAKVTLVEYGSLTCPHCRAFQLASAVPLSRDYVRTGLVAYELRNLVLNGPDVAASVLARCEGPARYFPRVDAFFRAQPQWIAPFTKVTPAQTKAIAALPLDRQVAAFARLGRLDGFVAKLGMPRATFDRCLANKALTAQLDRISKTAEAAGVRGTPTFFINGATVDGNTWEAVEPALRAALNLQPKA